MEDVKGIEQKRCFVPVLGPAPHCSDHRPMIQLQLVPSSQQGAGSTPPRGGAFTACEEGGG